MQSVLVHIILISCFLMLHGALSANANGKVLAASLLNMCTTVFRGLST